MKKIVDSTYFTNPLGSCAVVLCRLESDKFRAYIGVITGKSENADLVHLGEYGSKLTYEQAHGFFPTAFTSEEYYKGE